jgi:uncharacterized protein with von Willebrand factor type A (vWA) domain
MKITEDAQTPEEWAQSAIDEMLLNPTIKTTWDNIQNLGKEIEELKQKIDSSKKNKVVSLAAIRLRKDLQ